MSLPALDRATGASLIFSFPFRLIVTGDTFTNASFPLAFYRRRIEEDRRQDVLPEWNIGVEGTSWRCSCWRPGLRRGSTFARDGTVGFPETKQASGLGR